VPAVVSEAIEEHPGSYRLDDEVLAVIAPGPDAPGHGVFDVPAERVVIVGYTSGSTGRPVANPKTWSSLLSSAKLNSQAIRAVLSEQSATGRPWILATVPSQHMYGFELTVLLPLLAGIGIHGSNPMYPFDIAAALEELPKPRVLVTTPVHLRALLQSPIELPPLAVIVSATAPLEREIATAAEDRFGATVLEFFGSTETCVIASRRTAHDSAWHPYSGLTLTPLAGDGTRVSAPWLPEPTVLQDQLDVRRDGTFHVTGRNADMVEVAGKRASLGDLTRRLLSVPGVTDAVVFQPDSSGTTAVKRLAALVVADGLTERGILARLAPLVDPVFLPRPLVLVARLPRNDVGKLPREELLAAIRR